MSTTWGILFVLAVLVVIALPTWNYSRSWTWTPTALLAFGLVVFLILLLTGHVRAQEIEGAQGAVVVPSPLTVPTVQPITVSKDEWWTPAIGPVLGLVGIACTVGGLFLWQLLKRFKANTELIIAMAAAAAKRTEERLDEQRGIAAQKVTIDSMHDMINGGQSALLEKVSRLADRVAVLAPSKASAAEAVGAGIARAEHAALERAVATAPAGPEGVPVVTAPVVIVAPPEKSP